MSLSPGVVLPKDMDARQWSIWNKAQTVDSVAATAAADAVAAHVALPDPHTQYVLDTDLAALHISSGTYTPTLTSIANITATVASVGQFLRVGNVVTVSGQFSVNPVLVAGTATRMGMSLPIASNFAATENAGGVSVSGTEVAIIVGDSVNDRVEIDWSSLTAGSHGFAYQFTYLVI